MEFFLSVLWLLHFGLWDLSPDPQQFQPAPLPHTGQCAYHRGLHYHGGCLSGLHGLHQGEQVPAYVGESLAADVVP